MNLNTEYIKKLMGWCPNARSVEAGQRINLESFEYYTPAGARGEGGNLKDPGWFRRESSRILLPNIVLTFVYLLLINQIGLNLTSLGGGLFAGLAVVALHWNQQMQRYDTIAKKPVVRCISKKRSLWVYLAIILFILFIVLLPYMFNFSDHSRGYYYSYLATGLYFMWGAYFQLTYWEKKNHMRIYVKNEKGFQKTYALGEKGGKL